ncbi:MAG: hypothetical protein EON55_23245, partial [Alphaproteobacteria bacterium]
GLAQTGAAHLAEQHRDANAGAAVTFLGTRLLAEGVRLFASAIPIKLLLDAIGLPTEYVTIIAVLTLVTVAYTYAGGIRAVIWTDAIQMTLYIGGACVVGVQFALFSLVGALLWVHLGGKTPAEMGLRSSDDLFPRFILDELPAGLSGLLIAGILSATMGSLSSALNSMATSTVADLWRASGRSRDDAAALRLSRILTLVWAVIMAGFACLFTDTKGQVVLLGLGIAGYTYGALLGAFLLGLTVPRANQRDAVVAFVVTLVVMTVIVRSYALAFTWYVPLGVVVTLLIGYLLSRTHAAAKHSL